MSIQYTNFRQLIIDLIRQNSAEGAPNIDNFDFTFLKNLTTQQKDYWEELLYFLKHSGTTDEPIVIGSQIYESSFNEIATNLISVFNYINKNADLSDDNTTGVWNVLTNAIKNDIDLTTESGVSPNNKRYFWNESMNYAIALFLKTMNPETGEIYLGHNGVNDVYLPIADVKNADAGWSFIDKWVKPLKNINELEYEQVRAEDAIKSVLKNSSELQYTHTQEKTDSEDLGKWMRLVMPKYLRKVEVEDLNRNFWVIAQVVSAICAYLFGDNSLAELLRRILNELVQLWENVLGLWALSAILSQKAPITKIHTEVVPIANSKEQSYIKFDNFGATAVTDLSDIEERIDYIINQYSDSHVVIIPQVREGNYKHNYYYRESYPGALVYNRNTNAKYYIDFKLDNDVKIDGSVSYPVIDLKYEISSDTFTYADRIGSISEDEIYYQYVAPFSDTVASATRESSPYYAALRTIPSISATYNEDEDSIKISNLTLKVYDVSQEIIKDTPTQVIEFTQFDDWSTENVEPNTRSNLSLLYSILPVSAMVSETLTDQPILRGYYLGELVSYQSVMAIPTYSIESQPYHGQQMLFTTPRQAKELMEET